jgi:hypothetical protein
VEAARDDERQHVGDAGHQVLIGAGARGGARFLEIRDRAGGARRVRLRERQRFLDDLLPAVKGGLGGRLIEALAGEAGGVHVGVGGDDHGVGAGDLFVGELVLGADRVLGLDLDVVAERRGGFLERLGG